MKIRYATKKFQADTLAMIDQANTICEEYAATGHAHR